MFKKIIIASLFGVAALAFAGCSTPPVTSYQSQQIGVGHATIDQVSNKILRAARMHHWKAAVRKPGLIVASIDNHGYLLRVNIHYTRSSYSIHAVKQGATPDRRIVLKSNRWIRILNKEISRQIN